jgi:hypothetical protein
MPVIVGTLYPGVPTQMFNHSKERGGYTHGIQAAS